MKYFLAYLLLINALGFLFYVCGQAEGPKKAMAHPGGHPDDHCRPGRQRRESLLGMYTFRHKTRHPKFTVGIPVIFVLQIGLLVWYFFLR